MNSNLTSCQSFGMFKFGSLRVAVNGLGLCEGEEFKAIMFNLAQMFIRNPNVQLNTEASLLQNTC